MLWKVLMILHIIERFPDLKLHESLDISEDECNKMIQFLNKLDLVDSKKSIKLTDKGKNVLKYFYKETGLSDTPFILIK